MVKLSRAGDRSSKIGFYSFLIPLLMDAFFHKALPAVFEPPVPGLIHNTKYRFHQVAVRKRWERLAQTSILLAGAMLAARAGRILVKNLAAVVGTFPSRLVTGFASALPLLAVVALGRKRLFSKKA
jgi:hypothetical protein